MLVTMICHINCKGFGLTSSNHYCTILCFKNYTFENNVGKNYTSFSVESDPLHKVQKNENQGIAGWLESSTQPLF